MSLLAIAVFIGSGLGFALMPGPATPGGAESNGAQMQLLVLMPTPLAPGLPALDDLWRRLVRPDDAILWPLLVAVWLTLAGHAVRLLRNQRRNERAAAELSAAPAPQFLMQAQAGPPPPQQIALTHARDHRAAELAPMILALLAGAAWPWVDLKAPVAGFALAVVMLLAALAAAVRGQRDGARIRQSIAVGFFAGWATGAAYAAFAGVLTRPMGVPPDIAGLVAMLLCAGTGVMVQVQLRSAKAYSIGLIWALAGIAAVTLGSSPLTGMAAVLGISALGIALVRAAS